jgi:HK97 family phage major capsid protein
MSEQHLTEDIHAADTRVEHARVEDIETKAASGSSEDVALAFDEFMRAFEAFKATNEERIGQIEKRLSADVLTSEKLDRINSAIDEHKAIVDEFALKSARPQLGASSFRSGSTLQHKTAFEAYVRHGEAHGLHSLEEKALSVGSGPDGGYLVPAETEAAVIRGVKNISPIRAHRRQSRGERHGLQEAVRHHRSYDGLGGRDGGAA